jgi:RimJ/RimL family protein N-acetyltransferase
VSFPTIESERLHLHVHRIEDFDDSASLWCDPIVTKYIGGRAQTREEVWAKILRNIGHWTWLGFGYWVVREKSSGRFAGEIGFGNFRREVVPSLGDAPEAGWVLMPWAHGRGYATEAVRAAHTWLEGHRGPTRTVCMIDPGNDASVSVATKCGYREWQRTTYKDSPTVLYERPATESRIR